MATIAGSRSTSTALVLLLGLVIFLNYVDRGAIGVAAPLMKTDLELSAFAFGLAVSAFSWVYAPLQLIVGWLCDRFSVYRLLAWGVVLWAAATFLTGFVGGLVSLVVLRALLGVGESFGFPASSKIIAEQLPPERRGMANAVVSVGLALGPALGTLAGGLILISYGWREIFIVFGLVTLLWLLPWHWVSRGLHAETKAAAKPGVPVGRLIRKWPLWAMSLAHFASNYGFYFILAWLPLFLVQSRGLSLGEMTLLATLAYSAQAAAALVFGAISDRWTRSGRSEGMVRRWMMVIAQIVQGAAIVGMLNVHSMLGLGILLCIAGIATGALSLNIFAVAQMFAGPRATGTWCGFQNAMGNISGILGPLITGAIIDLAGYDYAFYVAGAVAIAGGLWWIVGVPQIEQVDLEREPVPN
jgi:MFS family permease